MKSASMFSETTLISLKKSKGGENNSFNFFTLIPNRKKTNIILSGSNLGKQKLKKNNGKISVRSTQAQSNSKEQTSS